MKTKNRHLITGTALLFALSLSLNAQDDFAGSLPVSAIDFSEKEKYTLPERPPAERAPAGTGTAPANPFAYEPEAETATDAAETEDEKYARLSGRILDDQTGTVLEESILELFYLDENGEAQRSYTGRVSSGTFDLPLFRGYEHIALLRRHGYQSRAVYLGPVTEDRRDDFFLSPERPQPPAIEGTPISTTSPTDPPATEVKATETSIPSLPVGYYRLTQETSLRRGATHESAILLRFQPGDEVEVLEKSEKFWWKVRFQGKTGYVKSFLLKTVKV